MTENKLTFQQFLPATLVCLVCVALFAVFVVVPNAQARNSLSGNEVVVQEEAIETQFVKMSFPSLSVATSGVLIDRSATTYFQHLASGTPEITRLEIACESKTNSTTTVEVGVITYIDASGSWQDVSYFERVLCTTVRVAGTIPQSEQRHIFDYSPNRIRLSLNKGTTTGFLTDDVDWASTNFPNELLRSPAARTATSSDTQAKYKTIPERGDVVVRISNVSGTATPTISAFYRIEK